MAKQIITDEESILKRQARRRLIGAIALTILVVVLLPMILDSEPPTPKQDIDLQIPDKDKVGEFVPKMVLPPSASPASQEVVRQPLRLERAARAGHWSRGSGSTPSGVGATNRAEISPPPVMRMVRVAGS